MKQPEAAANGPLRDSGPVLIPDAEAVRAYLADHSDLAELLPLLCEQACSEFGPQAELSLELYQDPEAPDRYLTLYVRQSKYDSGILERIERVSEALADGFAQASGDIVLTTDFRPPRSPHAV